MVQQAKKAALMKSMIKTLEMIDNQDKLKKPKKLLRLVDSSINKLTSLNNSICSIDFGQIESREEESVVLMYFFHPTESNL